VFFQLEQSLQHRQSLTTKYTKHTKVLKNDSLALQLWEVAKINQQSQP
jgi:hypothetical protein